MNILSIELTDLSRKISTKMSVDGLDDTDEEWELFIKDHRKHILERSTVVFLTNELMTRYEYHLRWFLEDNRIETDMYWIIMYINNIKMESEFFNIDRLYIPDINHIKELRKQFNIFKKMLNSAEYTL
jgi:hypothetical protein